MDEAGTLALLRFFASVHDLGKFSLPFQNMVPELARRLGIPEWRAEGGPHHTELGMGLWSEVAPQVRIMLRAENKRCLSPLAAAAFGHHGEPVSACSNVKRFFKGTECEAQAFVKDMADLFLGGVSLDGVGENGLCRLSWLAAGLFVLSDWVGSNSEWFEARAEVGDVSEYWGYAVDRARIAVAETGVLSASPSGRLSFHEYFPGLPDDASPHPLQRYVLDLPDPDGPELLILEDQTGGGKTEAAILAAHRHMRAGTSAGVFVGLPTMATSNAMYARLAQSYRRLFADEKASLVLAHGGRALKEDYLESIGLEAIRPASVGGEGGFWEGGAACSAWIADNRKKALLAPCGVGTLDQALLGVLPSRHQCLRLLGLSRSTLVADEIHSYDEYTGTLACSLLSFHAALGGSVVLLSATMTRELREKLVRAWVRGRELAGGTTLPEMTVRETAFPLATRVMDTCLTETPVAASRRLDVAVTPVSDEDAMFAALADAHRAGACACWVRNTVGDALAARRRLVEEYGVPAGDALLFHARFAGCDRQEIESQVLATFGKESRPEERGGKILISTQVVEQSLDLDFDVLLSDLAPMELLIQRAGRCHRHQARTGRPEGYRSARMLVLMPEPVEDADAEWYGRVFPSGRYVYPRPDVLWRTARLLADRGRLLLPEDARALVEGAYAGDVPEALLDEALQELGKEYADKAFAENNRLRFEAGYHRRSSGTVWDRDQKTPTRLGQTTRQVRLVRVREGQLALWGAARPDDASMRACLRSEVRLSAYKLAEMVVPPELQTALDVLTERMPDKGRWSLLVPLVEREPGRWFGAGRNEKGQVVEVRYVEGEGAEIDG